MKSLLPSLVLFCLLFQLSIQYDCYEHGNRHNYSSEQITECYKCMSRNADKSVNIPILNGRFCFTPSNDCHWEDEPVEDRINQDKTTYCGTEIETCNAKIPSTKDYNTCIYTQVETPYKCCYVGNGKHNYCMALDVHDKKIFKETLYHIRVFDEDYQGDYEIECASSYLKVSSLLFLALFFFF